MFRLKEVLKEKNVTAKELAVRAGITPVALSRYINGESSPRLDLVERLAELLEVDIVDLIKEPNGKSRSCVRRKTKEQLQHDTYVKLLTYCKFYFGEEGMPLKFQNDPAAKALNIMECNICFDRDMYEYDTGGNSLRQEFYLRVASRINGDRKHYAEYMERYFGDRPKILNEMYDRFGRPEEVDTH